MGLMMRRRRPLMRVAGAAAVGTVAYKSGKRHEQQAQVNDQAQQAYAATQAPPPTAPPPAAPAPAAPAPAAPAPAAPSDTTAELERLAQLHQSGALSEEEFSAAKAKLLGI
jgi:Short C-terminal domain